MDVLVEVVHLHRSTAREIMSRRLVGGNKYRSGSPPGSCCEQDTEAVEAQRTGIYSCDFAARAIDRPVLGGEDGFLTGSDATRTQVCNGVVQDAGAATAAAHLGQAAGAMV